MPSHLETTAAVRMMERQERLSDADRRRLLAEAPIPAQRTRLVPIRGYLARTLVDPCREPCGRGCVPRLR